MRYDGTSFGARYAFLPPNLLRDFRLRSALLPLPLSARLLSAFAHVIRPLLFLPAGGLFGTIKLCGLAVISFWALPLSAKCGTTRSLLVLVVWQ